MCQMHDVIEITYDLVGRLTCRNNVRQMFKKITLSLHSMIMHVVFSTNTEHWTTSVKMISFF